MPDGTDISGSPSATFSMLGAAVPAPWQREVLRAFQTWAVQANLNIGLTTDNGLAMGAPGAPQEDPRFGDVRIGARPLSNTLSDSLAGSVGFSHAGGTWSGDIVLNTKFQTGIGQTANQYDLYTIMVQEAGNALSLLDNPNDNSSVMYPSYRGELVTGLANSDITAIRQLYGPRVADRYEGTAGNDSFSSAYDLTTNGNISALAADATTLSDVDVYRFTTPSASSGVSALTIDLRAAGRSLFTGRVSVYDANQNLVGTAASTDPLANNVSVPVSNYQAGATYFVKVEGANSTVFAVGGYNLHLSYNKTVGVSGIPTQAPYVNYEGWSANGAQNSSQALNPISTGNASTFAVGGLLTTANDVDWFRFTPAASASGTLTLSVWSFGGSNLLPSVDVFDSTGTRVPTSIIANDNGLFTIQAVNRTSGATYYARIAAADSSGSRSTGLYVLGTNLSPHAPTLYEALTGGNLGTSQTVSYATMSVGEARLTQFALSASTDSTVHTAIRMSIFDSAGHRVFTLVAGANDPRVTGAVWLPAGTYTVVYNAATRTGAALTNIAFSLMKWERSSPIDPVAIDPLSPPPPPPPSTGEVVITQPAPTPPPGTIGPISDPYGNT